MDDGYRRFEIAHLFSIPIMHRSDSADRGGMKLNCWEARQCGLQAGGRRAAKMGVCPASADRAPDGVNGGINGGRICWALPGTLCRTGFQGTHAQKLAACMDCEFYRLVRAEEGANLASLDTALSSR
jgi:hypothetical protein